MTFNFLELQDKDYDDYCIVELTKDELWAPQNHYDDLLDNMRHVRTISTTEASTCDDTLVKSELPFYDAIDDDDRSYWFSSDTFACHID
jgi:hypothetical protein